MLTPRCKLERVDIFRTLLTRFLTHPKNFHSRIIIPMISGLITSNLRDSKQIVETLWFFIAEEVQAGGVGRQGDDLCFFYSEGVILIDYMEKKRKKKLLMDGTMYQNEDNRRKQSSRNAEGSWGQIWSYSRIMHPFTLLWLKGLKQLTMALTWYPIHHCSPHSTPAIFSLFPKLKSQLWGGHFGNVMWRSFWKPRMPPSSVIGLQCSSIVEQLMSLW